MNWKKAIQNQTIVQILTLFHTSIAFDDTLEFFSNNMIWLTRDEFIENWYFSTWTTHFTFFKSVFFAIT